MLSEWSFETRRRFRMAAASSAPSEAYGARPIPSFTAHRYRLNPFSKMLRGARSTPSSGSSMPRSAITANKRASTAGFFIR